MKTPVNLITGFLGVGKTTAILDLLARRPAHAPWAVLVNEFGQVGIDGATLTQDGVAVREVPGGCICCSAQLPLRVTLTRLLREVRPQRLLIEPTGIGHPAGVIDVLRSEGLANAVELRNVICLVDPRQLSDARYASLDTYRDQLSLADLLVANKSDLASAEQMQAFRDFAANCYPSKRLVATVNHGQLESAWLDIVSSGEYAAAGHVHDANQFVARGWTFTPEQTFDQTRLRALFDIFATDARIARAKGVFRFGRDWRLVNLAQGELTFEPIAYRSDSRVDIIAHANSGIDWREIEQGVLGALQSSPKAAEA
jgi:G3E family GTPase